MSNQLTPDDKALLVLFVAFKLLVIAVLLLGWLY